MTDLCKKMEEFGKAIGNATRYKLVQALIEKPHTVNELVAKVSLTQSAVSQHLKVLRYANIVIDERRGQEVVYRLNTAHTLELLKQLSSDIKQCKSGTSKS